MMIAFRTIVSRDTGRRWDAEAGSIFDMLQVRPARRVARPREPEVEKPVTVEQPWIEDQYEEGERWDGMS